MKVYLWPLTSWTIPVKNVIIGCLFIIRLPSSCRFIQLIQIRLSTMNAFYSQFFHCSNPANSAVVCFWKFIFAVLIEFLKYLKLGFLLQMLNLIQTRHLTIVNTENPKKQVNRSSYYDIWSFTSHIWQLPKVHNYYTVCRIRRDIN